MAKNIKHDAKSNAIVTKAVKGVAVSIIFYLIFSCIASILVLKGRISEDSAPDIAAALSFVSLLAGGITGIGGGKSKRPIVGIFTASIVILIKLTVCALSLESIMFGKNNLTVIGCMAFGGLLASLLSASKQKRV